MRNTMEPLQIEQFKEGLEELRREFSNRIQNIENHWKHWVSEILADLVNTKYRKHHHPSSDEIVVNHQSPMSQQTQLSELIEMVQWPNWEGSSSYSVESEIKVSNTNRHSQTPLNTEPDESPNSSKPQRTTNHSDHQRFLSPLFLFLRVDRDH